MKSSQSNFDLRSPSSYLARSYLIATVLSFTLYWPLCIVPSFIGLSIVLSVTGISVFYSLVASFIWPPIMGLTVSIQQKRAHSLYCNLFYWPLSIVLSFTGISVLYSPVTESTKQRGQ